MEEIKPVFIYCLWCPLAKRIRYIGQSNQPEKRISLHLFAARRRYYKHHTSRWLRKLHRLNLKPRLRVLMRVPDGESWAEYERQIIARAHAKGWPLTNQTAGGEGIVPLTEGQRLKVRAAQSAGGRDPEGIAKRRASLKEYWADPQNRESRRRRMIEHCKSPEVRKKLSKAAKSRTPQGEARRIVAVRQYCARDDVKRKSSERMKARLAIPGYASELSSRRWRNLKS